MINKSYLNRVRKLSGDEVPSFMKRAVAIVKYQKRVNSLKAKGAIPFTETGFEKISWDMFQKTEEPDFGSIWVVTTIKNANDEDEKWLVVNVDDNDKILRSVKASITKKAQDLELQEEFPNDWAIVAFPEGSNYGVYYIQAIAPNGAEYDLWESNEVDFGNVGAVKAIEVQVREKFEELKEKVRNRPSVKASITKKAIIPGDSAMYEYEPGKFQQVFVAGIEERDPETGENTFKVMPMRGGGEEHFIVEEKKLKSASVEKKAQQLDWEEEFYGTAYFPKIQKTFRILKSPYGFLVDVVGPEFIGVEADTFEEVIKGLKEVVEEEFGVVDSPDIKTASKKTSHTPGAIVQVVIPQGGINEKYNGKVGEVVAAVPDRSKISFKDMPSLWFEDNTIKVVASCKVCDSDISLQSLKKLGKVECSCGAFYSWRQLEKIAKTTAVNERAVRKTKKKAQEEMGDVWQLESPEEQDASYELSDIVERAFKDSKEDQEVLEKVFEEKWDEIKSKLEVEGSAYYVWWMDGVHKFMEMNKTSSIKKAKIVPKGDEFCVEVESGRNMGCYATKEKAEKRLKQVEMFKHMKGSKKAQLERPEIVRDEHLEYLDELRESGITNMFGAAPYLEEAFPDDFQRKEAQEVVVYWMETFSERHKESKTAQNVIFWFDDPKALKNLRYLQGPPTSPAGEEELLEKPGLEEEKVEVEKEVEKEASKKTAQEEFKVGDWVLFQKEADGEEFEGKIKDFDTEPGHVIIEDEEGQYWTHVDNLKKSGKRSSKKTASMPYDFEDKINAAYDDLEELEILLDLLQIDYEAEIKKVQMQRGDETYARDLQSSIEGVEERIEELKLSSGASKNPSRVKKSVRNFEVGDSVQIMDKEGNTNVVPKATIAQVDEYLGTDGQMHETVEVTGSANEDEQMWYGEEDYQVVLLDPIEASKKKKVKVSTEMKKTAREKIGGIVKEALEKEAQEDEPEEVLRRHFRSVERTEAEHEGAKQVLKEVAKEDYNVDLSDEVVDGLAWKAVRIDPESMTDDMFNALYGYIRQSYPEKIASIKKKAQGGGQFEMLRGGGGGSQDQLEPMGWQVQETKTPQLPEGDSAAEGVEEIEEIVIRVSPEDKSVQIDFEGEKEEEVEKPVGAEAPPEKPVEKPREGPEEEEGLEEVPVNF